MKNLFHMWEMKLQLSVEQSVFLYKNPQKHRGGKGCIFALPKGKNYAILKYKCE